MNSHPRSLPPEVTLRDIAKSLGISHSAVSRALHNSPLVSVTLREQIRETAKKMGYRPNPMAVALGQQRHHAGAHPVCAELAWINYWRNPKELRGFKEFDLYWNGAQQAAEQFGYNLEEFFCHGRITPERLEDILLARNVAGILLPPHRTSELPEGFAGFDWDKFSIVRFGYSLSFPKVSVVGADHMYAGVLAFHNIRRLGYRRIGYIYSLHTTGRAQAGFLMKQQELPAAERIAPLIVSDEQDQLHQLRRFASWLKKHRPDAILTDIAAMRKMLEKIGYRVPEDIGLATTSVLDGDADAGIVQNSAEIGKVAVEALVALINYHQTGIPSFYRQILIEGAWADGASLPRRNSSSERSRGASRERHPEKIPIP